MAPRLNHNRTIRTLAAFAVLVSLLLVSTAEAQVFRVNGDFGVGFRYDRRESDGIYQSQMGYESFMRAGIESWLFDPRFLEYNAWARVFWRDIYADTNAPGNSSGYGALWDDNQRYLDTDFNIRLTFFQKRPYVIRLYALRNNQNFDFASLPPYEIVTEAYGAELFLLLKGFNVHSQGEWRKAQYFDFWDDYDYEAITSSTFISRTTDNQKVKIRHRYEQRQDLSNGFDYIDNNLNFSDDIQPSKTTRLFLGGGLRRYETGGGANVTNTYNFSPSFQWRHDEWSIYEARSEFIYSELEGVSSFSSSAFTANVLRQVKRGLWLKGGAGGYYSQRETIATGEDYEQTTENAFAGVNYTRLIRYYRATGALDTAWGYSQHNPGDEGMVHNHAASVVVYDQHLKTVLWYAELRGTYAGDETPNGVDSAVYYAKVNVRNKKTQMLTYWVDVGFTDSYFYYRDNDLNSRNVNANVSMGYPISDGHNLKWGISYVYYMEPTERNMANASISYDATIKKRLMYKVAAQYYYVDPNESEARTHIAGQAEIRYKIRSLTLSGKYLYNYRELNTSLDYQEHVVYIQAKRDFKSFWVRRPKPKMMKMMQMSR